jgi:hypothetical protein
MALHESKRTRLIEQIKVCDDVIERLSHLEAPTAKPLVEDVETLRSSFRLALASLDGDGAAPSH